MCSPLAAVVALLAFMVSGPLRAEPPRVAVDIAPVHALVAQVMAGVATPELLLDRDANPHSVQLRPGQARMLARADLLIWVGPALSPWLERVADGLDADQIVLMEDPATHLRWFTPPVGAVEDHAEEDARDHGSSEAHDHDDGDDPEEDGDHDTGHTDTGHTDAGHTDAGHPESGHHDHDHTGLDPHLWLSVDNARAWLGLFAEALAGRDPENAARYRANAAAAQAELDALTARIEARLTPYRGAEIVTFHDAFGYFAESFGLTIAGSVRPGDAATPSAAAMAALENLVASHDIACAFAEPGFDPGLLDAIAGASGLRIGTLDPTGALQPPGPGHYAATLEALAEGIARCIEGE